MSATSLSNMCQTTWLSQTSDKPSLSSQSDKRYITDCLSNGEKAVAGNLALLMVNAETGCFPVRRT
eukprot:646240-Heterocapsa_arctica.AAC.1